MKKIFPIKQILFCSFFFLLFCMCKKTNNTVSGYLVTIDSISPNSGVANTVVTIRGKGFSLILTEDTVKFNGKLAQVIQTTDTTMQVYAPAGAGTGTVTISVRNLQAQGPVFTYLVQGPAITGINPNSGQAGVQVTIAGSNFSADTSKDAVYFNGVRAAVVSATATQIVVIAPTSTTGNVTVTVAGAGASGPVFTYTTPAPVITDVVYNGLFGISGQHFDPTASVVKIGGQVVGGFIYSDQGNGQDFLENQNYTPASNLDNPATVTVTVNSVSSNVYSFLFYPQINSVSPDTVYDQASVILQGILFGTTQRTSTLRAFYYNQAQKVYMSPDPTINSWNGNSIQVTMPDYGTYPIGNGVSPFYLEVTVGTKSTNAPVYFHIL